MGDPVCGVVEEGWQAAGDVSHGAGNPPSRHGGAAS
jgi:hypothetical protein